MLKIIRSQFYQLVLDKMIFIVLLLWAVLDGYGIYRIMYDVNMAGEPVAGSKIFGDWLGTSFPCVMVIAALVMTKDHFDKTLNYDILSGNSRTQVFMGRFVTALIVSEVSVLASVWTFPLVYTAFRGWGESLSAGGALFRTLLIMLFVFRLCAEMALLTMLFKRKGIVFFMIPAIMLIPDLVIAEVAYNVMNDKKFERVADWMAVFTIDLDEKLCYFDRITLRDNSNTEYLRAMPDNVWILVFCTLGLGVIFLAFAWRKFVRKDME